MNYTSQSDHAAYVESQLIADEENRDWEVVIASDMMLMLDFDTPEVPSTFPESISILEQALKTQVTFTVTPSRSGNKHVIVHLPTPMDIIERIAWQAALKSDPKREALHLLALAKDEKNPIVLVMPKAKNLLADGGRDAQPLLTEGDSNEKPSASLFADVYAGASESSAFDPDLSNGETSEPSETL